MATLFLIRHFKDHFQLDRSAKRKACNTVELVVFSEYLLQQLRSGVCDFRLIANIPRSGHRHTEPDDSRHFVERSQMPPRDGESI